MRRGERDAMIRGMGQVSAECLLCDGTEPPVDEFSFDEFWVRGKEDWPDYTGGPVHRVCADLAGARRKR